MVGTIMSRDGKIIAVLALFGLLAVFAGIYFEHDIVFYTGAASITFFMAIGLPGLFVVARARERWLSDDVFRHAQLQDQLTGLPNQVHFRDRLKEALDRAQQEEHPMALLGIEVDRFKDVVDAHGRQTSKVYLVQVAQRLMKIVGTRPLICRLGGSQFAVAIENISSLQDIANLAERICGSLSENYVAEGLEVVGGACIGIAIGPMDGTSVDDLLEKAARAARLAKESGGKTFRFVEKSMDAAFIERRALSAELDSAIRNEDFELHYQPQLQLGSGHIAGYEALLRWSHPTRGLISPGLFLPIAEETGLTARIGEWVLWSACSYAATWPDDGKVAVNVSPEQLHGQDLVSLVRRVLRETGLAAERLELEITERFLLQNGDAATNALAELSAAGVAISIDDFGTGYASLRCLARLPVNKIKIDKSLINGLGKNAENDSIVKLIIGVGKSLGAEVVAEGVESGIQAGYLRAWGCDLAQGFFYGKPKPEVVPVCLDDHETDFPGAA